jgi:hypothetical protein
MGYQMSARHPAVGNAESHGWPGSRTHPEEDLLSPGRNDSRWLYPLATLCDYTSCHPSLRSAPPAVYGARQDGPLPFLPASRCARTLIVG